MARGVVLILGAANYQQHRSRLVEDGHDVEQLQMSERLVCLVAKDLLAVYRGAQGFEVDMHLDNESDSILTAFDLL